MCKELNENGLRKDICSLATHVNKSVMESYGQIQAPVFENQLGGVVFFTGEQNRNQNRLNGTCFVG